MSKKQRVYYYLTIIFVVCVLIANVLAGRLLKLGTFQLPSSILIFPITFIIGDLLTEIYGFKSALKVTIIGLIANLFLSLISLLVIHLPAPSGWELGYAYEQIFSFTPRVFLASFSAFLIGSISNSYIMILLKKITNSKMLWLRTILSTVVGEFLDSFIFCTLSFIGIINITDIFVMIIIQATFKIIYETIFTPLLYILKNKITQNGDF